MKYNLPVEYDRLDRTEKRAVRLQYIDEQNGLCQHCQEPLEGEPTVDIQNMWINRDMFPPGFLQNPVHLHHCHNTGLTIGAVHARCNAVLWQYHGA